MSRFFKKEKKTVAPVAPEVPPEKAWDNYLEKVLTELQRIYDEVIEPVEKKYQYDIHEPSWFSETIRQKRPFVTFLGPFSSGKSSFINYLVQSNCLLTGPQPVTDKFTVIMYGDRVQQIPGRVLMSDPNHPFRGLSMFGDAFAECFHGMTVPHPLLRSVSFIDTPGVLEAAGDIHARRYDYVKVCRWFAEKSDLVFCLFDPTKLDTGNELRSLFKNGLSGFESKIRIVLNKADTVGPQELMRVYGALFWNLSNLISTTEPPRVYVSSFWDRPYAVGTDHKLFTEEKVDLLFDLTETVPTQSLDRRVTSVLKRANNVLIFALVCAAYKSRMPTVFGKNSARTTFFAQYDSLIHELSGRYHVSEYDFPSSAAIRAFMQRVDTSAFYTSERLSKKGWITALQKAISQDIPQLLQPLQCHAVSDPRERKEAIMVQRDYTQRMSDQLSGKKGIQGGLGVQRLPEHQASLYPPAQSDAPSPTGAEAMQQQQMAAMMQQMQSMMQQMTASQQSSVLTAGISPTGNDSERYQEMINGNEKMRSYSEYDDQRTYTPHKSLC